MDDGNGIRNMTVNVNPRHSAHWGGLREGASTVGIVIIGSFIALSVLWPEGLQRFWVWLLISFAAVTVGVALKVVIARMQAPSPDVSPEALRQARAAEQARQIEEAKARGDFDRFGKQ